MNKVHLVLPGNPLDLKTEAFCNAIDFGQGGFPFSTRDCGWIVADCTAEGLKSLMLLRELCPSVGEPVAPQRLYDAVNVVSSWRSAS